MISDPKLLAEYAHAGGIPVPQDLDNYDKKVYAYWHLYRQYQLKRLIRRADGAIHNARFVAKIPIDRIATMTVDELSYELG